MGGFTVSYLETDDSEQLSIKWENGTTLLLSSRDAPTVTTKAGAFCNIEISTETYEGKALRTVKPISKVIQNGPGFVKSKV
ncbi:hypothetical protein A3K34_02640 [candidate division WWE3 bacterium RIFOXYC1_FULL_40_10]|nr:MAG: hypothetical protein A3K58_02640 [candidate division WWE3 bacterium RIFOXYB1_FULL_40_22]OGC61744.1 MAG: hypothetical protein A3K37_02640 [candidate division WWE3 bacterium RIFOXYA1_FULL_40_11]OGC66127.1 MAG: hypothetical protein A3K34_02640 [candidate division WWE3 bacterium RIFOXYC1_FULL_40_10]OGC67525.1 MAG: hypothetical protein A2450_03525 [candidate division WWE3 bacterium RIFOXYC2_FULL_40_11]OGC70403.1 MAG: hypothetical protein A2602_04895 [candidate division WWE3 bacterium RIFOXYD